MRTYPRAALPADFRARALRWAATYAHCVYCEPNDLPYPGGPFQRLLAVAATPSQAASLEALTALARGAAGPLVGFATYELKNELESLRSNNPTGLAWPMLHFLRQNAGCAG